MSLLVIMAHFDVDMKLRNHVVQAMETYLVSATKLVVVSTSGLADEEMNRLPVGVEFHTRRNYGYDFFSYKWGFDLVKDYQDFDRVLVVNDSFVGPVVPVSDILNSTNVAESDFSGLTLSNRHGSHIQSFFFTFTSTVSKSKGMRSFWRDLVPISDRFKVISNYEIGLSQRVSDSGFKIGSFFSPDDAELKLARERWIWHLQHRLSLNSPGKTVFDLAPHKVDSLDWNPAVTFADRILDNGRFPVMKFDTLRYDPYALGADSLLRLCEIKYPTQFAGVRSFLSETSSRYPFRAGEKNMRITDESLSESGLGYR